MDHSDDVRLLRAFVRAHETLDPRTNTRQPIMYLKSFQGNGFKHHAMDRDDLPVVDDALLEEMQAQGTIDIQYQQHSWLIVPTPAGREAIATLDRAEDSAPVASLDGVTAAIADQAESGNKFAWGVVRPVLSALKDYWEEGGYSQHGIAIMAILESLPESQQQLFLATIRTLMEGDYIRARSDLGFEGVSAEVVLTDRAHAVLDGWPGAAPDELFENLIAVLKIEAEATDSPTEKKKYERVVETLRELGVATAGEVLAKVATGAG